MCNGYLTTFKEYEWTWKENIEKMLGEKPKFGQKKPWLEQGKICISRSVAVDEVFCSVVSSLVWLVVLDVSISLPRNRPMTSVDFSVCWPGYLYVQFSPPLWYFLLNIFPGCLAQQFVMASSGSIKNSRAQIPVWTRPSCLPALISRNGARVAVMGRRWATNGLIVLVMFSAKLCIFLAKNLDSQSYTIVEGKDCEQKHESLFSSMSICTTLT